MTGRNGIEYRAPSPHLRGGACLLPQCFSAFSSSLFCHHLPTEPSFLFLFFNWCYPQYTIGWRICQGGVMESYTPGSAERVNEWKLIFFVPLYRKYNAWTPSGIRRSALWVFHSLELVTGISPMGFPSQDVKSSRAPFPMPRVVTEICFTASQEKYLKPAAAPSRRLAM